MLGASYMYSYNDVYLYVFKCVSVYVAVRVIILWRIFNFLSSQLQNRLSILIRTAQIFSV